MLDPKQKEKWEKQGGLSGHVNADIIKSKLFEPSNDSVVFLCGPPAMIQKAALPALKGEFLKHEKCERRTANNGPDWGYKEDENCFGF